MINRAPAFLLAALVAAAAGTTALAGPSGASGGEIGALGTAAQGATVFTRSCQGCHPSGGRAAGVGPKLAGRGFSAAKIRTQVRDGGPSMPGGLATGADLDAVVAYVVSIQRTAPRVRVLRPTKKMKKALNNALRRKLAAKKISRRGLRGPLRGTAKKRTSQVKWARRGRVEWAIGTFRRPPVGTRNQPEIFRRVVGKRWVATQTSRGCFAKVPTAVRRAWRIPKGRCRR